MFYDYESQLIIAATYARVSTFKQAREGISLEEQERKMLAYAETNNIQVPEEYRFREAVSGLKDEREEYDKIRRLIRERKINALIIYSSDRQTRDPIHGKIFRAELRRSKATLHSVTEGGMVDIYSAQGELLATIKDAFNRYWLDKILEVTYEKKQEYLRKGVPFVQGSVRYGYKRVGKKLDAQAVIDEEVAPIIRQIFNWAEEGLSVYQIDKLLRGTPAPGDRKKDKTRVRQAGVWGPMAVYRILRDEIYAGIYWANREETYEDEYGIKRKQMRPKEEWIAIPVPAIVSREQWEKVQHLLSTNRKFRARLHGKYQYLLSRRITCGKCGYSGTTQAHPQEDGSYKFYYQCSTATAGNRGLAAPKCGLRKFRVPETDDAVWEKLKEVVNNPQTVLTQLRSMQERQRAEVRHDDEELQSLDESIEEQTNALKVAVRRHLQAEAEKDAIMSEIYQQEVRNIRGAIEALEQRKARLKRKLDRQVISDEEIQSVQDLVDWARPLLEEAEGSFEWKRRLIDAFNWRFTLLYRGEQRIVVIHWHDWDLEVEVNYPPPRRKKRK